MNVYRKFKTLINHSKKHYETFIQLGGDTRTNMKRAVTFYSAVLGIEFYEMDLGQNKYALFPVEDRYNNGTLAQGEWYKPSQDGVTIYLDGGNDLSEKLDKVSQGGGTLVMEKTYLSEQAGYIGLFIDSEGNKIGLQHM